MQTRDLLAVETKDSFVLRLAKFTYQKNCINSEVPYWTTFPLVKRNVKTIRESFLWPYHHTRLGLRILTNQSKDRFFCDVTQHSPFFGGLWLTKEWLFNALKNCVTITQSSLTLCSVGLLDKTLIIPYLDCHWWSQYRPELLRVACQDQLPPSWRLSAENTSQGDHAFRLKGMASFINEHMSKVLFWDVAGYKTD